jgi:hypothetical protein
VKLSDHSRNRLIGTFAHWAVPKDYADPMYNYLVYSFNPGSFFTAVLANDFAAAIQCSHPANTISALKNLTGWIRDAMPTVAHGSYLAVKEWTNLDHVQRRAALESNGLVYSVEDEMMLVLQGAPTLETVLW